MKRIYIFALASVVFAHLPALATIINIPDDYPTIQQGIDASTDGDTVLVQPNTYYGSINFNGHNIVLGSLFLTTGDTSYISSTIIWGRSASPTVTFESGEDIICKLIGFTLTARMDSLFDYVTGIKCISSSPTISKNSIVNYDNIPEGPNGAGISCYEDSQPIISDNIILNNSGHYGGAIYSYNSQPLILNNLILYNAAAAGGAIKAHTSQATIIGNIISSNVSNAGGGIELYGDSSSVIYNNIIANNTSGYGGGITCRHRSTPIIVNNLFVNNYAAYRGGAIYCEFHSNAAIKNTIFWADSAETGNEIYNSGSSPSFTYCDIEGGWYGEGNIDIDPLFRDPENGDFHLMSTECGDPYDSPCIDAGHPDILDSLLDCSWGLGAILSDMGAYGGGDSVMVGIHDLISSIPGRFSLSHNYPNPFNAITIIRYSLPEPSDVVIEIYDILGRMVETLVEEERPAGFHQIIWNAKDKSSGTYFCRIQSGDHAETRKMVFLK